MSEQEENDSTKRPSGRGIRPAKPRRRSTRKCPPKHLPQWKVILHNDDINGFNDVVKAVRRLVHLSEAVAVARVREAHQVGCALLLITHLERAELYVEQFASCNIMATAEPDI
jgi:ATP-dependent Clp protease adaptor protein ClpS